MTDDELLFFEVINFYTESLDDLRFYEGSDVSSANLLFELDGYGYEGWVFSTAANEVLVRFTSDYSVSYSGFRIYYNVSTYGPEQKIAQDACSENQPVVLGNNSQILESLLYPAAYPEQQCQWLIQPSEETTGIYVTVLHYNAYDYLYVYDGVSTAAEEIAVWYGTSSISPGDNALAVSGSMFLFWDPTYDNYYQGFQLVYHLQDPACEAGTTSAIITNVNAQDLRSPAYPYILPTSMTCRWLIRAYEDNQNILLTVQDLDLHESPNCAEEYLEIIDGDTADGLSLGVYCGNDTFGTIPSLSNAVQIYLRTKATPGDVLKRGFSIVHQSGTKPSDQLSGTKAKKDQQSGTKLSNDKQSGTIVSNDRQSGTKSTNDQRSGTKPRDQQTGTKSSDQQTGTKSSDQQTGTKLSNDREYGTKLSNDQLKSN